MTTPFQNALIAQRSNKDILARVLPNFRKMGKDKFTLTRTQARIDQVEDLWKTCKALHIELQQLATGTADVTDEYFMKQEFLSIEEDYISTFDILAELRNNIRQASTLAKPAASHDQSAISNISDSHPSVQLPRIQVPTFSRNLIEWENFHDLFESLVARNEALLDSQRLHYLKSSVTSEASLSISHLKITDSNYGAACKLLKDEYDNKREIIHAHIQSFADLPVMKTESATELKTLRDAVTAAIAALSNLQRSVDSWDDLLVYIISQKFSAHTRNEWNMHLGSSTEYPTYKQIRDFLTIRIRGLAAKPGGQESNQPTSSSGQRNNNKTKVSVHNTTVSNKKCPVCSASHYLTYCPVFKRQSVEQRRQTAKQSKVCFNCLRPGHFPNACQNQQRCTKCQRAHHSLLHRDSWSTNTNSGAATAHPCNQLMSNASPAEISGALTVQSAAQQSISHQPSSAVTMHSSGSMQPTKVLLATAWVMLRTHEGRTLQLRALLDQGSLYSFVSESVAQSLKTTRYPANMHVTGFGEQYSGTVKSHIQLTLEPCHGQGPQLAMIAYVFKKLTAYAATKSTAIGTLPHLQDLPLANPHPDSGEPIQLLSGADLYGSLLLNDLRQGPVGTPTGQHTIFGWILSGPVGNGQPSHCLTASVLNCVSFPETDRIMQSLWEVENVPIKCPLTKEDLQCAEHFDRTHSRTDTGEYVVRLPFRDGPPIDIGESLTLTKKLYDVLEKRLNNKPELATEYTHFLSEYESLGHMEVVKNTDICRYPPVYIPHHPVLRDDSSTTHLRVVFNASSKTSNRTTLNDHLLTGPKLQADLSAIILRWRQHCYVYTADIAKMYRQIRVHRDDADYQRILWWPEKHHPILVYRLLTLAYGTAPAPYLAMRVLQQLASDEGSEFPTAVDILKNCIYVDDILFGADDLSSLREARSQLIALCARGEFRPRKWAANQRELLADIPAGDHELAFDHPLNETDTLKVLGVTWLPDEDSFKFQTTTLPPSNHTKRTVLSFIARLFDPLGWATPVIIAAKIFMQDLWLRKIEWDDPISDDLQVTWNEYYQNLHYLSDLRIPRWTGQYPDNFAIELHGFADASSRAYGAVVYARVLHTYDPIQISLLAAKSKVAPLKTLSIPRLELYAAVLLTKLLKFVRDTLNLPHVPVCGWSDSTVALAWISQHPSKWKTFTANRVSDIQTRMPEMIWKHVDSKSNPADCAFCGISAEELRQHSLWWAGPTWLSQPSAMWPSSRDNNKVKASDYHTMIMS